MDQEDARSSPEQDADPGASRRPSSGPMPLKRGTACKRCRYRKIRCSGERPVCGLCLRDGHECVFDEVKVKTSSSAKSKINALETKIAELEKVLTRQLAPAPPAFPHPAPFPTFNLAPATAALPAYPPQDFSQQFSHFQLDEPASAAAFNFAPYGAVGSLPAPSMPPPRPPPAAFAGPSALVSRTGSSSSASSFPYPPRLKLQSEEARREADQRAFMAEIERLFGTADGPGFVAAGSAPIQQQQQQQDEQESERQQWATMPAPTSLDPTAPWATGTEVPALVRSALSFYPPPPPPDISPTPPTPGTDFSQYLTFASPPASQPPDVVFQDEPTAFDVALQEWVAAGKVPERLPTVVRDELVDMSLRFRRQVALIISPEELVASLDRPEDKRPHPGLLWAMFTHGSRYHPSALVHSLQEDFFRNAKAKLEDGVGRNDRVIDVVRGTALLSSWLFMNGRFHEGYLLSSSVSRLAMAAMLHRMSWPLLAPAHGPAQARWLALAKRPAQLLAPPASWAEATDRLYAFWQVVAMDRLAAITTHLPACIPDDEIETPFAPSFWMSHGSGDPAIGPRPLSVAELFSEDEVATPGSTEDPAESSIGASILQSLLLLSRIARLSDPFVQPSRNPVYLAEPAAVMPALDTPGLTRYSPNDADLSDLSSGQSPAGVPTQAATAPMPPEMAKLERILGRFIANLPARFLESAVALNGFEDDGRRVLPRFAIVRSVQFLLQSQVLLAQALLAEEQAAFDHATYWPKCVVAARSIVQLIRTVADVDFGRLDIFMGVCWKEVSRMLVAEARLQRDDGNEALASAVENEIEVLILSMKRLSTVFDTPSSNYSLARTTRTRPPAAQPWRALASATAILIGSAGGARSSARVPISAAVDRSAARFRRRPPRNRDDDDALSTPPFQPASSSL